MEQTLLTVPDQVKQAMDGRTNRWLAMEVKIPETELSRKLKGKAEFTEDEIKAINARLKVKIKLNGTSFKG